MEIMKVKLKLTAILKVKLMEIKKVNNLAKYLGCNLGTSLDLMTDLNLETDLVTVKDCNLEID